ncbi:MAG: DUF4256 domain-containing protein [Patescibacteria group bacterium]
MSKEQFQRLAELTNTGEGVRTDVTQVIEGDEADAPEEASEKRELSPEEQAKLLSTLETRLTSEPGGYKRPEGVNFAEVKISLEARPDLMYSLAQTENAGGAVDIRAIEGNEFVFCDFAKETDESRRNLTYPQAEEAAKAMGVDIQSKEGWRALQKLGAFDTNSWIWVKSDDIIDTGCARDACRDGGGLVVDRYGAGGHRPNGGWRASLRVPKA